MTYEEWIMLLDVVVVVSLTVTLVVMLVCIF